MADVVLIGAGISGSAAQAGSPTWCVCSVNRSGSIGSILSLQVRTGDVARLKSMFDLPTRTTRNALKSFS